ncbi:hypothetical protein [Streptomyces sp. NPDC059597]|uniref:hypothetical protein n=1 Tax=Streptomyces sp. NPDC059597 TaxID=3346879 RepID=UPI0036A887E1
MNLWPRRRRRTAPRADPTTIAILEHDLFGIPPKPGTLAAAVIALRVLRHAGDCLTHEPDMTTVDTLQQVGRCARCGATVVLGNDGEWTVAAPS